MVPQKHILAVCGKGGVGKTSFSALLSRAMLEQNLKPLLLIDADPAGGLVSAIGEKADNTLAGARNALVVAARGADDKTKERLTREVDYLVMQALVERSGYAFLAIGYSQEKGCFCPANILLRSAIDILAGPFAALLIDAEAGLEQINRQVTGRVSRAIVIVDGSQRSLKTLDIIKEMIGPERVAVVANRRLPTDNLSGMPGDVEYVGSVPEDHELRRYDIQGRSLWALPEGNKAFQAVKAISERLKITKRQ